MLHPDDANYMESYNYWYLYMEDKSRCLSRRIINTEQRDWLKQFIEQITALTT